METEKSIVARRHLFSCAHFYKQEKFSDTENTRVFGACYTPNGHGHNYVLEIFVDGVIDPSTRLVINLSDLDECLKHVTKSLDHKHVNFDVPEFAGCKKVPTTENIALYLREKVVAWLSKNAPYVSLNRLKLFETDDLWVEVRG